MSKPQIVKPVLKLVLALTVAFHAGSSASLAQDPKNVVQEVVTLFSAPTHGSATRSIYDAVNRHMDYEDMCENLLGTSEWEKLPHLQRNEFQGLVQRLVEQRYYPRWHKIFSRGKITYLGEAQSRQDRYVKTELTIGKKQSIVVWHLHPKQGELAILSLSVGSRDLLISMTSRFQRHLHQDGVEGVLAWLQKKIYEDEETGSGQPATADLK